MSETPNDKLIESLQAGITRWRESFYKLLKVKNFVIAARDGKIAILKHENNQLRKRIHQDNATRYRARLQEIVEMADKCLPTMPSGDAKDLVAYMRRTAAAESSNNQLVAPAGRMDGLDD